MDSTISRAEHEEFRRRMEEEHARQNKRIEILEQNSRQLNILASSTEKLAMSFENMCKEQEQQGKRLEMLENRDGEMWRKVVGYIATAVIGIVLGFVFRQIGM